LRVAFLGTSEFAVAVLRQLGASPYPPEIVVTPPDRPRGRGRRVTPPPVAATAKELDLPLLQTERVNLPEAVEHIRAASPDIGVVCAFGQLIKEPLLSELELLNVHPSLIPRWRGAAPIERAIMAGDAETGVTIMRVTEGLDSGPVALQARTPISPSEDYGSLSGRLASLAGELTLTALARREANDLEFTPQDDSAASYAEKIRSEERRLDPGRSAEELARVVRALCPHIGAYVELAGGDRLGVLAATPEAGGPPAGELEASGETLRLGCSNGSLRLDTVQPSGRRPMPASAYLRGHRPPQIAT
jgi:methionyl-tRNA formyltransferase